MPFDSIDALGIFIPDTSQNQAEVEAEYKAALGADLNVAPETPEGILITAEVTSRTAITTNNAQLANQINPNIAGGVFLDAIMALTGVKRDSAEPSTFSVPPDLTGVPGTPIPAGTIAENANGDKFESLAPVTLVGGVGSVAFASVETGAIACGIADLTVIVTSVIGWETITNTVAATLGTETQSDISARSERKGALGLQGSGLAVSVSSAVRAVAGVTSLSFRENETASPIAPTPPDNITLVANSIWACVSGGSDADVASALLGSKSGGCNWNNGNSGNPISENVTDPTSGQIYTVLFDRPDDVPVLYEVTIKSSAVTDAVDVVKQAILAYAAGELDGEEGLVTGADVSPWEASGAINAVEPALTVTLVRVTTVAAASLDTATIDIELFEQASVEESSISVIVI